VPTTLLYMQTCLWFFTSRHVCVWTRVLYTLIFDEAMDSCYSVFPVLPCVSIYTDWLRNNVSLSDIYLHEQGFCSLWDFMISLGCISINVWLHLHCFVEIFYLILDFSASTKVWITLRFDDVMSFWQGLAPFNLIDWEIISSFTLNIGNFSRG
jgi:hypothetical protein